MYTHICAIVSIISIVILPEFIFDHHLTHDTVGWIFPIRKWFVREVNEGTLPLWFNVPRYGFSTLELQFVGNFWSPVAFLFALFTENYDRNLLLAELVIWRMIAAIGVYSWIYSFRTNKFISFVVSVSFIYSHPYMSLEPELAMLIGYSLIPWVLWLIRSIVRSTEVAQILYAIALAIVVSTIIWTSYAGVWIIGFFIITAYGLSELIRSTTNSMASWRLIFKLIIIIGSIIGILTYPLVDAFVSNRLFGGDMRNLNMDPNTESLSKYYLIQCINPSLARRLLAFETNTVGCFGAFPALAAVGLPLLAIRWRVLAPVRRKELLSSTLLIICTAILLSNIDIISTLRRTIWPFNMVQWYGAYTSMIVLLVMELVVIIITETINLGKRDPTWANHELGIIILAVCLGSNSLIMAVSIAAFVGLWRTYVYYLKPKINRNVEQCIIGGTILLTGGMSLTASPYVPRGASIDDWARERDVIFRTYRGTFYNNKNQRISQNSGIGIINLEADVPHLTIYPKALQLLESADNYWQSPTKFVDFAVWPTSWFVKSSGEITVSADAVRGGRSERALLAPGWRHRTCGNTDDDLVLPSLDIMKVTSTTIGGTIETACETLVIWMDTYDEKWKAFLDGEEVKIYRVNNAVRGLIVSPQNRKWEMQYRWR